MEGSGICPCCGGAISNEGARFNIVSGTLIGPGYSIKLSRNQSVIFALLWAARNTGGVVSQEKMFDHLYSLDPNGGPDFKIIEVMISKMRKALISTEFEIVTFYATGYSLRNKSGNAAKIVISHRPTVELGA